MSGLKHIPTASERLAAPFTVNRALACWREESSDLRNYILELHAALVAMTAERDALKADAEAYRAAKNEFLEQARRNLLGIGDIDKARGVK